MPMVGRWVLVILVSATGCGGGEASPAERQAGGTGGAVPDAAGDAVVHPDADATPERCSESDEIACGPWIPAGLVVAGGAVYWIAAAHGSAELMKVSVGGGAVESLGGASPNLRAKVAADGAAVYWMDGEGSPGAFSVLRLMRLAVSGGAPSVLAELHGTAQESLESVDALGVGTTRAYWSSTRAVLSAPIAGGPAEPFFSDESGVARLAVDATDLYYLGTSGFVLKKVPLTGGTPVDMLQNAQADLHDIDLDSTSVYFANGLVGLGAIHAIDKSGGAVITLAEGRPGASGLVERAESVYWVEGSADRGGLNVVKVSKTGGEPVVLASGAWHGQGAIDADDTHVYFGTYVSPPGANERGSIRLVPR
jgi:hypothetical protein